MTTTECTVPGCREPVAASPEEIELGMPALCERHLVEGALAEEDE